MLEVGIIKNLIFCPKLNYKKMPSHQEKRVTKPLFYCCMLAKWYINLHKKFLGLRHRDQQYMSVYVSICQYMSVYVSICQYMLVYVSICFTKIANLHSRNVSYLQFIRRIVLMYLPVRDPAITTVL